MIAGVPVQFSRNIWHVYDVHNDSSWHIVCELIILEKEQRGYGIGYLEKKNL